MLDGGNIRGTQDAVDTFSSERLVAWQTERVREVLDYARREVPFYRDLWAAEGAAVPNIGSLADLEKFPIVSKPDLVRAGDRWATAQSARVAFSTRGTSGEPLLVWLSEAEEETYIVPTMRGFRWAGLQAGMTAMLMSPVWHRLAACEAHAVARMGGQCAFFWGSMSPEYMDSFLHTLFEIRPQFITSTAPFMLALLRRAAPESEKIRDAMSGVRSLSLVGLPLTPRMREFLRDRLAVGDVFERGGTQEGAALDECAMHDTPHLHEDVCYLEVVDEDGARVEPGQRGRLLVTKLSTSGSVFVRYDTGDIAAFAPGACACGCAFRRLKIFGRPESSVLVGGRQITAYDVRLCVEEDAELVGRNVLLVRDTKAGGNTLVIALEGDPRDPARVEARLRDRLSVAKVQILWLGNLRINWGFRQVFDRRELPPSAN